MRNNREKVFSCTALSTHFAKHFAAKEEKLSALQNVSFGISQGEFVCVAGLNGCGKSTLLRIMAGLIPKSSGEIHFAPIDGSRPQTAMVFQS